MNITEIVLIIAGITVFLLGYIIPARKMDIGDELQLIGEDEVRKLVDREMEGMKDHLSDIVDETVTYTIEKTERSMERIANEKIMAVNEYSDTVLEEINKNHKEVLFLYDMLNDKHDNLKDTVSEAYKSAEEIKRIVKDAEITARETKEAVMSIQSVKGAEMPVNEAEETVKNVENIAREPETFVPFVPPRVEIIHALDGDYVAEEVSEDEPKEFVKVPDKPKRTRKAKKAPQSKEELWPEETLQHAETFRQEETLQYEEMPQSEEALQKADVRYTDVKDSARNSNDRILELHKAGKSNMAIAKELGLGIGEVKLVIDLFEGL